MSEIEDDDIFKDVNDIVPEGIALEDINIDIETPDLNEAAKQIMSSLNNNSFQKINEQSNNVVIKQEIHTEEESEMEKYNKEKNKLFEIKDNLLNLCLQDQAGIITRNFNISQLVIKVGEEIDRINGLIVLRTLKARCKQVSLTKDDKGNKKSSAIVEKEDVVSSIYEVWGEMEDGTLGLTSSYSPDMVLCVINLKSGYDLPPD
jgi:hypothetical protein